MPRYIHNIQNTLLSQTEFIRDLLQTSSLGCLDCAKNQFNCLMEITILRRGWCSLAGHEDSKYEWVQGLSHHTLSMYIT